MEECKKMLSRIECKKEMTKRLWSVVQGYFTPALKKFRRPRWGDKWHSDWHALKTSFCCCVLHCCEYQEFFCGHPTLGTLSRQLWLPAMRYGLVDMIQKWLLIYDFRLGYELKHTQTPVSKTQTTYQCFWHVHHRVEKCQTTSSAVVWYQLNEPLATSWLPPQQPESRTVKYHLKVFAW
jgi:hypothetical protein